jgi:hypothetical protein
MKRGRVSLEAFRDTWLPEFQIDHALTSDGEGCIFGDDPTSLKLIALLRNTIWSPGPTSPD